MIGNNELHLNEATLIEALQFWLDAKLKVPAPTVTGVKMNDAYGSKTFVVSVSSEADRPAKAKEVGE